MLAGLKHFQESYHIRVLDLLKQIHFLEDLPFGEVILHIRLLNGLDCHVLASQLMNAQGHFPEGAFAYQLHEFVILEGGRGQFVVLLYVGLDELNKSISLLQNSLIHFSSTVASRATD